MSADPSSNNQESTSCSLKTGGLNFPLFSDLGKNCDRLMNDHFKVDQVKITGKSSAEKGLDVKANLTNCLKTESVNSNIEMVYKTTSCEAVSKWDNEGAIDMKFVSTCPKMNGMKNEFSHYFKPKDKTNGTTLKSDFTHDKFSSGLVVKKVFGLENDVKGVSFNSNFVVGHRNVFFGAQAEFLQNKGVIPMTTSLSVAYRPKGYELFSSLKNFNDLTWSTYVEKCSGFKYGTCINYDMQKKSIKMAVATLIVRDGATIATKVSSDFNVDLSYKFKMNQYASVLMSTQFDLKNLSQPTQKFGIGVDFEV